MKGLKAWDHFFSVCSRCGRKDTDRYEYGGLCQECHSKFNRMGKVRPRHYLMEDQGPGQENAVRAMEDRDE